MSFRSKWLNFIMHLTASIAELKQDLTQHHAVKTFFNVLMVILLEGVLAIVSIPLYFTTRVESLSPENDFNVQYSIRKTLTFTLFLLLLFVIAVKALVIARLVAGQFGYTVKVNNAAIPSQQQVYKVLAAPVNDDAQKPAIRSVNVSNQRDFDVSGSAEAGTMTIVQVTPKSDASQVRQIYVTQTDAQGRWNFHSSSLYNLPPADYVFQAQSFSSAKGEKSEFGSAVEYTLQPSREETLLQTADNGANILIFSFIAIGLLLVFLTF